MIFWTALTVGVTVAAGTYLALSRDVFRSVMGFVLMGAAVNLALFASLGEHFDAFGGAIAVAGVAAEHGAQGQALTSGNGGDVSRVAVGGFVLQEVAEVFLFGDGGHGEILSQA